MTLVSLYKIGFSVSRQVCSIHFHVLFFNMSVTNLGLGITFCYSEVSFFPRFVIPNTYTIRFVIPNMPKGSLFRNNHKVRYFE